MAAQLKVMNNKLNNLIAIFRAEYCGKKSSCVRLTSETHSSLVYYKVCNDGDRTGDRSNSNCDSNQP